MARDLLAYVPVALAWAAVAYKLSAFLRHPGEPALRSFWFGLLALALSLTTLLPPVYLSKAPKVSCTSCDAFELEKGQFRIENL